MRFSVLALTGLLLAGCVDTAVTQVSSNQILISTSAAPVCGSTGAATVAAKMAAVETLRRGFDRFIILGAQQANNTRTGYMPPTTAMTTGTYGYGTYTAQTNYYGGGIYTTGSHDAGLSVLMLRRGDAHYAQGVDARAALGPEWEQLVEKGITSCN